jgi:regulator of sigma E protease
VAIFFGILIWAGQPSDDPVIVTISDEAVKDIGFEAGDRVLSIAGNKVETFSDIIEILARTTGEPQSATVERDGTVGEIAVRFVSVAKITQVNPAMPAAQAGMQVGDVFLSIDGAPVNSYRQVQLRTAEKALGEEITVEINRAGELHRFRFVPDMVEREHPVTGEIVPMPTMGISGPAIAGIEPGREAMPLDRALAGGVRETWKIISGTLVYIRDMIFNGADTSQLGGPIRIAEVSGDAAAQGFSSLIYLIAVLSTSIGLINLFPIPILDGGHLMFYLVEFIRGRPVGETSMKVGTVIGLSLVLLLMVFATYNDLVRL